MKINNPAGERITFIFGRLVEAEDSFAILFTPPIIFQDEIYNLLALPPETTIESLITHSGKKLEKDKEYEFIPGEGSKVSTEFGALIFEGKSFEIKELAENESQVEASTSQQPKLSTKQSEPEQIVFTAERITGHSDTSNTLRIHFAEEIKYQTIKVKGLAILKILLREN
jgi:hypothetical protein